MKRTDNKIPVVWKHSLLKLGAALIGALVLGRLLEIPWLLVAIVLATYLGFHLALLFRLHRQLHAGRRFQSVEGSGIWSDLINVLAVRQVQHHASKRRLLSVLREFRDATGSLPDGVILLDAEFNILWFNPSAEEMLDLERKLDIGRRITNLIRDPEVHGWLDRHRDSPDGVTIDAPGNPERKLRLRAFSYSGGQHVVMVRDITQLQLADAMRKDFVANVSHELRTPLTVISGYVETMSGEVDVEWQPIIDKVAEQTTRMRLIIEDLLTLSRLDESRAVEEESRVDVSTLASAVASEARQLSHGAHTIEVEAEGNLGLLGSAKDLRSAFLNLVMNAVRYTPPGGTIRIRWYPQGSQAVLSVRDDGPGIASHHIPRLTERFYRVSKDRSRATGGTGLGLAIVKNVLLLHQASLEVESEIGSGSVFRCVFPAERVVRSMLEAS